MVVGKWPKINLLTTDSVIKSTVTAHCVIAQLIVTPCQLTHLAAALALMLTISATTTIAANGQERRPTGKKTTTATKSRPAAAKPAISAPATPITNATKNPTASAKDIVPATNANPAPTEAAPPTSSTTNSTTDNNATKPTLSPQELLVSESETDRAMALELLIIPNALSNVVSPPATSNFNNLKLLQQGLQDRHWFVQAKALQLLPYLPLAAQADFYPTIYAQAINAPHWYVRGSALLALSTLVATMPVVPTNVAAETLNVIAVAQVDAEPFVRRMAIKAAAAIRHPQSLFIIASALQDADLRVVWEAALHLAIVSLPTDTNIITTITVNGPIAAVAPINAPRATIDLILSAVLPDARFPLPLAVAQCLRGDIGQLAALKEALNTSDGVLRQELLTLFCRQVHHPAAVSILAEQFTKLASEAVVDETSQLNIIAAWGAIANDTVAPLLLGVISQKTENPNLRLAAIQAIGQFKSPSIIEQLLQELLKGQSTRVGEALLTTILNSADATTVEILLRARKDAQGEIRPVIELALQRLGITVENLSAQLQGNNFSKTLVAGQDPALNVRWLATLGGQSSINSLIANLKHPSSLVRIAAINILADLGEPRATENLFPLLDESNAQVRDAAATALKKLGFSSATLRTRLESPNWRVRAEAANLTGRMHFTELIPLLINNLSDKEVEVRTESVIALGKLQAIDALDSLIAALQDENSRVHCATAIALGSLGSSAMGKMLTEQLLQEKVLPALLPALNSYDIAFSALAAEAIVKLQPPNLAALLSNVVISRNWRTRVQAARILGSAMDMASINLLLKLLADKAAPVRYYARNSLIRQSAVAVKPLIAALKQQTNENDRYTLAQTLIGIGPAAVEDLLPILLEPAEDLRLITITVLAEIGDPRAITALLPLCDDPRFLIRQNAAIALGRLGPPALMPILELLNADKSVRQRISATITLRTLADPAAIPLLLEALNDKNAQLRAAAAEALAFIGDRSTLPALEKLTNDVADVVRAAVRNAINKIQAQH